MTNTKKIISGVTWQVRDHSRRIDVRFYFRDGTFFEFGERHESNITYDDAKGIVDRLAVDACDPSTWAE